MRPENEEATYIPLTDVATVLLGLKVRLGAAVLHQLSEFQVVTLICDWNGVPDGAMYGWREHSRIGARHLAQFSMTLPRRKSVWGQIIRAKISGQAANLRVLGNKDWRQLAEMAKDVRSGDPNNVEGRAARYYWARLFHGDKFSRVPQTREGRNAMLDYGYAVLRGHGVRAVLGSGLSPSIGVFHRNRANAFNLVDDVIEPFRPAIDWVVANMSPEMTPSHPAVKRALVAACSQQFFTGGPELPAAITDLAQMLGMYAERQLDRLNVPTWDGPTNKISIEALP